MVKKERAVGGLIQVGQRVDLMTTVSIKIFTRQEDGTTAEAPSAEGYYSELSTKVACTDLEVLSVVPAEDIYVLRVTLHDAEEIGHLQDGGASFGMVLRPESDNRTVDLSRYGETTNRIIEQHVFPMPQIIDTGAYPQPSLEPETLPSASPSPVASVPAGSPLPVPSGSLEPLAPTASEAIPSGDPVASPTALASPAPVASAAG